MRSVRNSSFLNRSAISMLLIPSQKSPAANTALLSNPAFTMPPGKIRRIYPPFGPSRQWPLTRFGPWHFHIFRNHRTTRLRPLRSVKPAIRRRPPTWTRRTTATGCANPLDRQSSLSTTMCERQRRLWLTRHNGDPSPSRHHHLAIEATTDPVCHLPSRSGQH